MTDEIHRGSIISLLRGWAKRTPEAVALLAPGSQPLTYDRLAAQVDCHVRNLADLGVGRTDRVVIALPQGPEMLAACLAVAAGATAAPINPGLDGNALEVCLGNLQPTAVILQRGADLPTRAAAQRLALPIVELSVLPDGAAGECALSGEPRPRPAPAEFGGPDDPALMLSTSGTTALSQLVPLTHWNILAAAANTCAALGLTASDRCLNVMPLFHSHGLLAGGLASLVAGGSVICARQFDASKFFGWLDECLPTWYTAVPAIHRAVLAEARRHAQVAVRCRLRFIRSASARLPLPVMSELERVFNTLVTESYGLSEAPQLTNTPLDTQTRKLGSVGVPGTSEVAIMDEAGQIVGPNQPGEIVCRGPVLMTGYYRDARANERSFRNGWFRTGDLGYLDPDGHLYMSGRVKDIINRGGEKVSPQEVDDVLLQYPDLVEAVTFPMPHGSLGEDVAAAVVVRRGAVVGERDIRDFAGRHLAPFKVPRQIVILDEIPKGPTGKVKRGDLAERLGLLPRPRTAGRRGKFVAPRTPLEHQVAAIWEELFDVRPIGAHDDFFELGGDSLVAAALMTAIEESCGRGLLPSVLLGAPTVARFAAEVLREEGGFDEPLTALRASGWRTPLFFVHNDSGRGIYTRNLARSLDSARPVYAVHLHGLDGRSLPATVEAIAADRLQAVRAARPHGPYVLGGHCNGGVIALEMARRLRAAGENVETVVLVDTPAPAIGRRALHRAVGVLARLRAMPPDGRAELELRIALVFEQAAGWARYYEDRLRILARSGAAAQAGLVRRKLAGAAAHVTDMLRDRPALPHGPASPHGEAVPAVPMAFDEPSQAYRRAVRRYVPASYAGPIVLFRAEELPATRPDMGWSPLVPQLEIAVIPGDHHTCITRHVAAFAARLEEIMQRQRPVV